ncbi:MAG: hypothetical protein DLM53_03370 [Candidatus Eremiobacter antarcticus]|nr:hypothetical protein [Candidatus Eremiobacteraeota bacterium]MBC5807310.1 hypothetical protein [Candidatus Eremiobacteraeota bacterium]PZR63189.1 MAG: hypothetical protein DLM53_03370 [Candidatus Eremiobacter sp. RRmetagenome_bin22]
MRTVKTYRRWLHDHILPSIGNLHRIRQSAAPSRPV